MPTDNQKPGAAIAVGENRTETKGAQPKIEKTDSSKEPEKPQPSGTEKKG